MVQWLTDSKTGEHIPSSSFVCARCGLVFWIVPSLEKEIPDKLIFTTEETAYEAYSEHFDNCQEHRYRGSMNYD